MALSAAGAPSAFSLGGLAAKARLVCARTIGLVRVRVGLVRVRVGLVRVRVGY